MRSEQRFKIVANRKVAARTYILELEGDTAGLTNPGQFVNVEVPGFFLRRPFSVCAWGPGELTLLYKTFGPGTETLTGLPRGQEVNVLSGLGNGFYLPRGVEEPLVVGGGVGIAPMLSLTQALVGAGTRPHVILGFGSKDEVALVQEIGALSVPVTVTTVDGSAGVKGLVTDAMGSLTWDYVYACGPTPMLRAVFGRAGTEGQYSMEERMACGFGACMGCVMETAGGVVRVCKEGPVFESGELLW